MEKKSYKVLKEFRASPDGIESKLFSKDEVIELDADTAEQYYHLGTIEEVSGKKAHNPVIENKSIDPVEKTKSIETENGPILHPGQDEGAEGVGVDFVPDGQTPAEQEQEAEITGKKPKKKS